MSKSQQVTNTDCAFVRIGLKSGTDMGSGEMSSETLGHTRRALTPSCRNAWFGGCLPSFSPGTSIPRVPYPLTFAGFSHPGPSPFPVAVPEEQLLSCGANDCLMATAPGNSTRRPSQELIYTLLGIYTGAWGTERVSPGI